MNTTYTTKTTALGTWVRTDLTTETLRELRGDLELLSANATMVARQIERTTGRRLIVQADGWAEVLTGHTTPDQVAAMVDAATTEINAAFS